MQLKINLKFPETFQITFYPSVLSARLTFNKLNLVRVIKTSGFQWTAFNLN